MIQSPDKSILFDHVLDASARVCERLAVPFVAHEAKQALADLMEISTGTPYEISAEMLAEVANRLGFRYRQASTDLEEMLLMAGDSAPIVFELASTAQVHGHYLGVLLSKKGRSFEVFVNGQTRTVSRRWLNKNVRATREGTRNWWIAQALFQAESASSFNYRTGTNEQPLTPLQRYIAFLRPEGQDIRTIVIFAFFVGILSLTTPLAVEALVNTIVFGRYLQPLIVISLIVFIFLAFRAGLTVLMTIVVEFMQQRIFVRVVDDVATRLTRVPMAYLKSKHGPELVNRFFDVVQIQKVTAKLLLESLMLFLQTFIGLSVLAFYHPFLLGYDIGLIALMAIVLYLIGRGAVDTAKKESMLKYETASWLQEIVRIPTAFKFNGGLPFALDRADELSGKYIQSRQEHFRVLVRQVAFSMSMQVVAATALLGLGGYLVIEQQMTLGQLVAAELIVTVILGSFAKIGKDLESYYDLLAAIDKLGKLFDLPGPAADRMHIPPTIGPARIDLDGVTLRQSNHAPVTAEIEPGSTYAIFGRSGCGKSELLEFIAGIGQSAGGTATFDGTRVDLIETESLQTQMAFVNTIEIFEGTIEENIRLGRVEIDISVIQEALKMLGLLDTISAMPKGLMTQLSVNGTPLSSGQSIRLMLVRALVAKPAAILVDGLLDQLADDDLQEVLAYLADCRPATTMVIATGRQMVADWADKQVKL